MPVTVGSGRAVLLAAALLGGCDAPEELEVSRCDWRTLAGCPAVPASCRARGPLPDAACTPGALNPDVTETTLRDTICMGGWTRVVRPPLSYTAPLKLELMEAYGVGDDTSLFQLDHLVPLELGGAPADVRNLWPLRHTPRPGSAEKDGIADLLRAMVCSGERPLGEAQRDIASDWVTSYGAPY